MALAGVGLMRGAISNGSAMVVDPATNVTV
jgi:hypothetical protein